MGKWSRRAFIAGGVLTGGVFAVGVAIRTGRRTDELAPLVTNDGEALVNAWVKVHPDNRVTAIVAHSEMGQGVHTALAQMLADEMDADWSLVSAMEAPAEKSYANYAMGKGYILADADVPSWLVRTVDGAFQHIAQAMSLQVTGGSASVRTTGVYGLRVAGAAARQMLIDVAADRWDVPASELTAENSYIVHAASDRRAPFADFAQAAGQLTPSATPTLKKSSEFKIIGQSKQRFDIPGKVDGSTEFGIDAQVPGMQYAAITHAPVFGATLETLDSSKALALPGITKVVELDNAVAVVGSGYWQASQALRALEISWSKTDADALDQDAIFEQFRTDMDATLANGDEDFDKNVGDAGRAIANAAVKVRAEYTVPYLAHACMEPMNATAWEHDGQLDVWTGCQNPLGFRVAVADALGLDFDNVALHNAPMGGGFGRRATPDYAVEAAKIARAAGTPVKLIWSREEDVKQDIYRPAIMSRFEGGLDANGKLVGWDNQYVDKHEPAEAPVVPYTVANTRIHHAASPTHVPFGPWRSVDHSQHGFFTESFVDEMAHAADADPYQFRRAMLADQPRLLTVLDRAATEADWEAPLPNGKGRGISLQESFGSVVAQVVEVSINKGKVAVDRVVVVSDTGVAVNPDGVTAQMESGVIYGLTAALYGEVSIANGAVQQSNFHDYPMVRMDDAPTIETHIINSDAPWGGAGEPGTPGIAPALANAIFDATGTRIRQLPVSKYDLEYRVTETDEVG